MTGRPVARVLLHAPLPQLDRLLDYAIPPAMAADAVPGVRVRVPLRGGARIVDGYIAEIGEADDPDRPLSELDAVVSPVAVLTPALYTLARRVADRAAGSASDILRLVIPKRQVRVEKAWSAARAAGGAPAPLVDPDAFAWATRTLAPYPRLAESVEEGERIAVDAPPRPALTVTGEHTGGWATLLAAAAVRTLAHGRSAVLVVPDHRDLDQLELALTGVTPEGALIRDDARRPAAARYAAYLRMLEPAPCIVIGNRSTVYAPVSNPGLLAIWDDGDPLQGEPLAPYVHARDAALVRQESEGTALLLAGHTRTTDVERLVGIGWVQDRPASRRETPRIVLSASNDAEPGGVRVPSAAFRAAREALTRGPVLVQVARPGYSPVLVCGGCRQPARCPECAGPLHASRRGATPTCRWCGRTATGWTCPHCSSREVRLASSGSERTAEDLGRAFPETRVIVSDGEHPVLRVDHRPALIVATRGAEPFADGGYHAVVLLDAERMLLGESLRIGESGLRWWSNAAALAAPGAPVHLVGVAGPAARAFATWQQAAYARAELAARAPLRMPPIVRVAVVEGDPAAVDRALLELSAAVPGMGGDAVLGPVIVDEPAARGGRPPAANAIAAGPLARALVRFDYAEGAHVTSTLRASVIAAALRTRRPPKGGAPRNTLRVRVDEPDPEL